MKNGKVKGIVLTLVGGIFWGVGGSCGQFLFENKEVTSGLLVPIRLFAAGLLILVLQLIRKEKIFDVWKEKRDAAETLLFALFGPSLLYLLHWQVDSSPLCHLRLDPLQPTGMTFL